MLEPIWRAIFLQNLLFASDCSAATCRSSSISSARWKATSEKLDEIIEQRLKMEKYLDFRFRNFVVISQKEIADYYRDVYVPRFKARTPGRIVPTQDEARAEIEKTLMEAKIESDTDAFLDTLRQRAEIVTLSPV